MDLRRALSALVVVAAGALAGGCGDGNPMAFSDHAVLLPATVLEALPLADKIAHDWNPNAYVAQLGGGFTVTDAEGRARNHSFVYYARFGPTSLRRLTIDFINEAPWTQESIVGSAPLPFPDLDVLDSDEAVRVCIQLAAVLNQNGQVVPPAQDFAVRLLSVPVWPEPGSGQATDTVAWRVDFLELADGPQGTPIWWSLARFYLDPRTGQFLDDPIVSREIYPNLNPLP